MKSEVYFNDIKVISSIGLMEYKLMDEANILSIDCYLISKNDVYDGSEIIRQFYFIEIQNKGE